MSFQQSGASNACKKTTHRQRYWLKHVKAGDLSDSAIAEYAAAHESVSKGWRWFLVRFSTQAFICYPHGIAILINIFCLMYFTEFYKTTFIIQLMEVILTTPFPYWIVVLLSGIGTFLSIRFGDELMDVLYHKDRYFYLCHHFKQEMILFIFFLFVIFGYYKIISTLDIAIGKY